MLYRNKLWRQLWNCRRKSYTLYSFRIIHHEG